MHAVTYYGTVNMRLCVRARAEISLVRKAMNISM
jgi:hypothetical protein